MPCSDARELTQFRESKPSPQAVSPPEAVLEAFSGDSDANRSTFSVVDDLVSQITHLLQTPGADNPDDMTFAEELAIHPPFCKETAQLPILVRGTQDGSRRPGMRRTCKDDKASQDHLVHVKGPQP